MREVSDASGVRAAMRLLTVLLLASCARESGTGAPAAGASASSGTSPGTSTRTSDPGDSASRTAAGVFRAVGNEPGWILLITDSLTTLRWDYDERRASARTPAVETLAGGRRYTVGGATPFTVVVRDTLCADGMSGRQFPAHVAVTIGERTLDGCGGEPDALLQGDAWQVDSLNGMPAVAGSRVTLEFGSDGRVTGSAGCSRYSAPYMTKVEGLELGPAMSTKRACTPEIDRQEVAFLAVLQGTVPYQLRGDGALVIEGSEKARIVARRPR
jgi:heat shock protein HslJ